MSEKVKFSKRCDVVRAPPDFVPPLKNGLGDTSYCLTGGVSYSDEASEMTRARFIETRRLNGLDTVSMSFDHKFEEKDFYGLVQQCSNLLNGVKYEHTFTMYSPSSFVIETVDNEIFIDASKNILTVYASYDNCQWLKSNLMEEVSRCNVYWYYIQGGGYSYQKFMVEYEGMVVHNEHYPFLGKPVYDYMQEYHDSKAPILVLLGEPGTGKTSFLKEYIRKYNLNAMVSYDERIIEQDEFYVDFMREDERDVLIIEDADLLLTSRESDANKAMSRLLNLSNGLVNILSKKIVFTTNLSDIRKVDDALIRPGRCFDVVNFRKLSKREHNRVSELHGLPYLDKKDATLAEVFNQAEMTFKKERIGFG